MKLEFGEFQFAVAVIKELTNPKFFGGKAKPVSFYTPTPFEESSKGYDVKINSYIPYFIQFKRPQYYCRRSAAKYKNGLVSIIPYFEFSLSTTPCSKRVQYSQHKLLKILSKNRSVYYCAPLFHTTKKFDDYYINEKIVENSAFISLSRINKPIIEGSKHEIVYYDNYNFEVFSEKSDEPNLLSNINQIKEDILKQEFEPLEKVITEIKKILKDYLNENFKKKNKPLETIYDIQKLLMAEGILLLLIEENK